MKLGVDAWSGSHPRTKTLPFHGDMSKGRLCHVPLNQFSSAMASGQSKNRHADRHLHGFSTFWTVFAICFICFATSASASASARTRMKISSGNLVQSFRWLRCFLHVRYIPLHKSQWPFWASVWTPFMPLTDTKIPIVTDWNLECR